VSGGTITTLTTTSGISVQGLTVGRGAGAVTGNTALGVSALSTNTTSDSNTAIGYQAGQVSNGTYGGNTFVGYQSGKASTTAYTCSFFGESSGLSNTTGANNTALGGSALRANTTASNNTAVGYQAGDTNTTGRTNVFLGYQAGYTSNTNSDNGNTCVGAYAGFNLTTGVANTFIGSTRPGSGIASGIVVTTGSNNTILGNYTGNQGGLDIRTASNHIVLSDGDGNPRLFLQADGSLRCLGVYNNAAAASNAVNVDASGNVYRSTSALKYKTNVRDLEDIDINLFRAVRYNSNCAIDNPDQDHFGLIADEVDAAGITELVNYGADGEVEGFQYERLTVVLLKSIQSLKAEFDAYKAAHP
jgi:hypothetical protein